jgi:hypothetical protein
MERSFSLCNVTFTTNPAKRSVEAKEEAKVKEYLRNRSSAAVHTTFIPMAVDSLGKWGPRMKRFFHETIETAKARTHNAEEHKIIARIFRYLREAIFL